MESSSIVSNTVPSHSVTPPHISPPKPLAELVIETSLLNTQKNEGSSVVDLTGLSLSGALKIQADEMIKKLNELLAKDLPDGIGSLKPEQFTPEATADRIVTMVTSLYPAYRKQHPELSDDEALDKFMELATKGVNQGYEEAFGILKDLGAFKLDGIEDSISKTRSLITEKFAAFESMIRDTFEDPNEEVEAGALYILESSINSGISIAPTAEENLQQEKVDERF